MRSAGRIPHNNREQDGPHSTDRQIAALAARQHGVVSSRQLAALGLSAQQISYRLANGRLHRVHHGVYAVGHRILPPRGGYMAAVLADGRGAALSHAAGGALWELRASAATKIDVTIRRSGRSSPPGLRFHRPRTLRPDEVTVHHGIPVTTPARTLVDLAAGLSPRQLERALDQAEVLRLTDIPTLAAMARTHPGHRGARKLAEAITRHTPGTTVTRSELEERFLALCDANGIPRPLVNQHRAGLEVDFLFADHRLVVETDGWTYHRTQGAFERDRDRDAVLTRAGYRTLRFTHRQITDRPEDVAATLAAALHQHATPGHPVAAPPAGPSPA
jgi:putative AbiEi antitoxin of type IV toxin-antitoxin system/uncharacterized protein DUF559